MILVWFIGILLIGGVVALLAGQVNSKMSKWVALITILADLFLIIPYWVRHSPSPGSISSAWISEYRHDWIPSFGISFNLSIDGLSLLLLMLTFFLGVLAVLCSWNEIKDRVAFYYFNLLWILAGITGVFLAMDLFLFYFFWELMLIPMYFLIGIWGSENRVYAAYKFFIFTQAGGLLMLLAILGLYFIHAGNTGVYTFNYTDLLETEISQRSASLLFLGFMIAFIVKLPVVPFHSWLPDAHGEAPTAGSLILAGLLLKTGAYGILRFAIPLFPQAASEFSAVAMLLGVVGIIYGAVLSFSQTDIKRLIAYTSVSHMGFVLVGAFAFNELALQGVVMQLLTHGLSTGALFVMAGMLKERLHTRDINKMGGLWTQMPKMGTIFLVFSMASLGLPGLGNFVAEFLILLGAYAVNPLMTILATTGLIFSAIYSLRLVQKVFLEAPKNTEAAPDISLREGAIMSGLTITIIWLGVCPQAFLNTSRPVVNKIERIFVKSENQVKSTDKAILIIRNKDVAKK